ncbi:helix-turn-helix transcriptional regulator [Levilactobacillus bambusae]|uniref:HTH cro/C1-type domain-containing protein n=1 Tax=Levilactobacillus bambusae TaxID=2024736 RepID=A0A2V1MYI0_9LACO|nr:helix-turn-helix transcriptional regulator [Levilactobacillus bambusae]PWF99547.1 hypothetical protein DCM90_08880 [Levilactobacillus bambusae]
MMHLMGKELKRYRKGKHLSQRELSEGICTQATVSLMEKQNKLPNMGILIQVCQRLGIAISDVVSETETQLDQLYREVTRELFQGNYEVAIQLMNQVTAPAVDSKFDLLRFHYYWGLIELLFRERAGEAIFHFNFLIRRTDETSSSPYMLIGAVGLGQAYLMEHDPKKADYFFEFAKKSMRGVIFHQRVDLQRVVWSKIRMGMSFYQLGRIDDAKMMIESAQQQLKQHESTFMLDQIFNGKRLIAEYEGRLAAAKAHGLTALVLARLNDNQQLIQELKPYVTLPTDFSMVEQN